LVPYQSSVLIVITAVTPFPSDDLQSPPTSTTQPSLSGHYICIYAITVPPQLLASI
jgi:hypothetical protein